ncbi:Ribokinase [bioreactor metagenome]|uniref:Ribokinase n=1 Tax=bioreactor metagenome TaxID=1076179 RepID=A0A645E5C5_9ZZZZ
MGGKGANQALAAHRLGGEVKFVSSLGKDSNGLNAMEYYKKEGLDATLSLIVDETPSGVAMIWVDRKGENSIVIIAGANEKLSPEYIHQIEKEILKADLIVLQMEIPYETVKTVCDIAHENGKQVLLNVAPARKLDQGIIQKIDILVVNETEAETISGEIMEHIGEEGIVDKLLALGAKTVILTLGKQGCILKNDQLYLRVPAFSVKAVDTTAAGDTFCGALAAELSKGHNWNECLVFASAAAAICVTRMGAQPSVPTETEVRNFLEKKSTNY